MTNTILGNISFENLAREKAEYPRLHMLKPESFKHIEIKNFEKVEKEISFEIGYHRGRKRWCLDIYTHRGIRCDGEIKFFSSIPAIREFIRKEYQREPILPAFNQKSATSNFNI
ncbi:hypothetical protein LCGC14_1011250 [marine sediment metagenome]|uniref:Uncharacterized protein n=1 Tax=marine sediment metagenome TaxID=412755 RepID=A0A0F9QIG2_9ZZZZ|nr:MAG: hypothetical protein Lokiarch_53860 [Candidatus Lokiarchaeum sp. GC14_75]